MVIDAIIFDAIRTPRGRGKASGSLHQVKPISLIAQTLTTLAERNSLPSEAVDDVILGCVTPVGEQGANLGKTAALAAGWSDQVSGLQINRFCASGLTAVNLAAQGIRSGWHNLMVAGGVESMSRVPMGSDQGPWVADPETSFATRFVPQGISADLIATKEGFSRNDVDSYAALSQERASQALKDGRFKSVVPVKDGNGFPILSVDEYPRAGTTTATLAGLNPAFAQIGAFGFDDVALSKYPEFPAINHVHTAGNSSGIVDGAAAVLIGSAARGKELGLTPRARITAIGVTSTEPTIMLTGPGPATLKALKLAQLTPKDIDLYEVNEAFAAVVLKFAKDLEIPLDKINVNGGAIALGHPLGATGAMILGTLLDELERQDLRRGLATLCVGGGMGVATIIERI